jgi:hypothetical protein
MGGEDGKRNDSASAAKEHYEYLISFHKWIVTVTLGALGVIGSLGLWFFYKDMSQVRAEARAAVEATKDWAGQEISAIRQEAARLAVTEAHERVDDAFKTTNVVSMVESAARRQVAPIIERQVNREVDRVMATLQNDVTVMGQLADLGVKMRIGLRSGLEGLAAEAKTAPNGTTRLRAQSLLDSISADYETLVLSDLREVHAQHALDGLESWGLGELRKKPSVVPGLVDVIHQNPHLEHVSYAFLALREATGYPFKMFDIEALDRWCEVHQPVCKGK